MIIMMMIIILRALQCCALFLVVEIIRDRVDDMVMVNITQMSGVQSFFFCQPQPWSSKQYCVSGWSDAGSCGRCLPVFLFLLCVCVASKLERVNYLVGINTITTV